MADSEMALLWRWDTEWPADTAEFCPLPPYRHLLLCGTYKLLEGQPADIAPEDCRRDGRIHLLDVAQRRELQRLPSAAILDIKWCPARLAGRHLAAAADATGHLLLLHLQQVGPRLQQVASRQVAAPGCLALALDWWVAGEDAEEARLAVSDSSGSVTVLQLRGETMTPLWTGLCHGHEAWTCGFSRADGSLLYTGGDDLLFRGYDLRQEPGQPVFTNRSHEAGVTSVQSDPLQESCLRTGSYDEHIYTWDARALRRPLSRVAIDGGVWRIKPHPRHLDRLLTACMYGGSHVTDAGGATVASWRQHKSIVYGADWCRLPGVGWMAEKDEGKDAGEVGGKGGGVEDGEAVGEGVDEGQALGEEGDSAEPGEERGGHGTVERGEEETASCVAVTCSFYDNLLCVWKYDCVRQ